MFGVLDVRQVFSLVSPHFLVVWVLRTFSQILLLYTLYIINYKHTNCRNFTKWQHNVASINTSNLLFSCIYMYNLQYIYIMSAVITLQVKWPIYHHLSGVHSLGAINGGAMGNLWLLTVRMVGREEVGSTGLLLGGQPDSDQAFAKFLRPSCLVIDQRTN